jgi:Tol biopolymer transport system component
MSKTTLVAALATAATLCAATSPANATFPGTNKPIVYEQGGQFWLVPADGGKAKRRFRVKGKSIYDPAVAPNGKVLAFYTDAKRGYDIVTYNFATKKLRVVTGKVKKCVGEKNPTWSPDGKRIAFQCNVYRSLPDIDIFSIKANGKGLRRVTGTRSAWDPAWSPKGNKIAYLGPGGVHIVNANGTGDHAINGSPPGIGAKWEYLDWSPSGDQLVVENLAEGLWLMDPETGAIGNPLVRGPVYDPAFSPDGTRIVYVDASPSTGAELFSIAVDGSDRKQLTTGGGGERAPVWLHR